MTEFDDSAEAGERAFADVAGETVDFVLGDGEPADRCRFVQRLGERAELALEVAEVGALIERFRALEAPRARRVPALATRTWLVGRHWLARRRELRRPAPTAGARLRELVLVATAAAAILLCVVGARAVWQAAAATAEDAYATAAVPPVSDRAARVAVALPPADPRIDFELRRLLDPEYLPIADRSFEVAYARIAARTLACEPDDPAALVRGWVDAENLLTQLRRDWVLRMDEHSRRRVSRLAGGPDVEDRVQSLAATIAARVMARLDAGDAPLAEVAVAARALLASGSDSRHGRHAAAALRCREWLEGRVAQAEGSDHALVLAALAEFAVGEGGATGAVVARESDRLARRVLRPSVGGRPDLLHWRAGTDALAEASRVLRLAPAFGMHAGLALRARMMLAAHLVERHDRQQEQPQLLAAMLYGIPDLIDVDAVDRQLLLWRAEYLIPGDFTAVHHLAWSRYPVRPGWARFQSQLRGLASVATPASTADAAALLLSLSMNFAAPGSHEPVRLSRLSAAGSV